MQHVMVIGAHPADPVDLAGGTMCLHRMNGDVVSAVSLTDGTRSHALGGPENSYPLLRSRKMGELEVAAKVLGVDETHVFSLSDEPLIADKEAIGMVTQFIRNNKPDLVITHHPNEYAHWDHAACGQIVCRALKGAVKLSGVNASGSGRHWVPSVYFFATQSRPEVARLGFAPQPPDILIDISGDPVEWKVRALTKYETQGLNDENKMWDRMNSFESEMGRADGIRYAEGFILYYPLKLKTLPFIDHGGFYGK
jgi:LmbE family N-acetylglucosaminyl deacetylase